MRAIRIPSKIERERLCSAVYDICMDCIRDNNATFIIALNQVYGFGHDRLRKVMDRYEELCKEFTERENDGFTADEIHQTLIEMIEELGLKEEDIYCGDQTYAQVTNEKRLAEKNLKDISYAEAKKAYDGLLGLKQQYSLAANPKIDVTRCELS